MRILMLAQFYAPVIGGEERHVQDLSVELVKRGHDVAVATLYLPGVAEFEVDQGVRVYRIKSTTQRASWLYSQAERCHAPPLPDPEVVWALRHIVAREKPDIVHAHNWLLYSFLPLKKWSGVPLVFTLHEYNLRCPQKRLMYFNTPCSGPAFAKCLHCAAAHYGSVRGRVTALTHRLMSPAVRAAVDIFLPVSQATAIGNGLVENQLPFRVIPNFVPDNVDLSPEGIDTYVSQLPEGDYLLFVGDLSHDKGIDVLLRAYGDLNNAPPLVLIGRKRPDTPTELPDNVVLAGHWPHAAVMEAWRRSSIALAPSVWPEVFGIVVIEAMAMARPVIASRTGGLTDIVIDGESGFLVPPGDSVALRQSIERLIDNPALREHMGQSARQRVNDFRASAVVPRIEAVYQTLTQTAGVTKLDQTVATTHATWQRWGWLPEIALVESLGLLVIAWAFVGARAATAWAELIFWPGLAMLIVPVTIRLASTEATRRERIALVLLLGMAFYLVKVMHSPVAFNFPDELSHLRNVREVLETHHLFQENPVQPVTAFYPGLAAITSTLVSLSGLPTFPAGLLVIGLARLMLFLSLYLLHEQISGSARVAGLATLVYMANPNFLYWTAQYAYESLALPLAALVLFVVVRREMARGHSHRVAWTVTALFGVLAVVTTHHMTSYVLTGFLGAITALSIVRCRGRQQGPWELTLFALLASSLWLIFVARLTIDYLSPELGGAIRSILAMIAGEEEGRQLFKASTGYVAPLWQRLTTIGSVILIASGLPFGGLEIWRRYRNNVFALVLAAIALSYLPLQMLRLTSAGWETANRASEFLFIGISFVLALGIVKFWLRRWSGRVSKTLLAGFVVVLFFGGLIAGWPPRGRLPRPYIVTADTHLVQPQGVMVARWMLEFLGPNNRVAASKANAKIIGAYGQYPFTGSKYGIKEVFFSDHVGSSELNIIRKTGVHYIVSDRRLVSWDHMIGLYFFNQENSPSWELELVETRIFTKFDERKDINRILDSGDIAVYDVGTYHESPVE